MKPPIPEAALDKHVALLGITGSGKTSVAKAGIVEPDLEAGRRVILIDPTGAWWGLRLAKNGKGKGFPIYIFGGAHGDYPLKAVNAKLLAETFAASSDSAIFDTKGMTVSERTAFFTTFAETFLAKNKRWVRFVIDESHLFMPQQGAKAGGGVPAMLHAGNSLVSLGRSSGLRVVLISQRAAKLHKDSLTQVHSLIAMQLMSPQDRDAISEWVRDQADTAKGKEIIASLPSLAPGEAWVWAPLAKHLERVRFPRPVTFDSSSAPSDDAGDGPQLPPINLDALKGRLAAVEADVQANDPKVLKAKVADLARQLAAKQPPPATGNVVQPESDEQVLRRPAVRAAIAEASTVAANQAAAKVRQGMLGKLQRILKSIMPATEALSELTKEEPQQFGIIDTAPHLGKPVMAGPAPGRLGMTAATKVAPPAPAPPRIATNGYAHATGDGSVSAPQQRILDALMWFEAIGISSASKDAVAFMADASSTSGGYFNNLGKLRSSGLIDYPTGGMVALTDQGRSAAHHPDEPGQLSDLHDAVRRKLPAPMQRILDEALRAWPQSVPKGALAERIGVSSTSGGYFNNLGRLRTLGLIDYPSPGEVQATEILFPESLR